jgi:hypothetical protein
VTRPTLGAATGLCLAAVVLALGLAPLSDNSFLTHLATGRLILDLGHVPSTDPYTFTAHGASWVVQSWLPSVLFGAADELGGGNSIRVLVGLLLLGIFALVWRLTRPVKGVLVRTGIAGLVIAVGTEQWSERPLLLGLLGLLVTVLAAEGELDPRWLLPMGWVWVNSHGSFPLGVVYLLVVALGRRLDHLDASVELRALRWLLGGIVLGAASPVGPRLLTFPVDLLRKQDLLRHVIEWQSPSFHSLPQRLFLLQVGLAVLAVVRRPRYRSALVVAIFPAAAMVGARNISAASLVLIPVLAEAWPNVGALTWARRNGVARILGLVGVAALVVVPLVELDRPAYDLEDYPTRALERLEDAQVDLERVRLAAPDIVGNLIELRDGPGRSVFYDDRFDMFPESVTDDYLALNAGRPSSTQILDRRRIDLVLWPSDQPLVSILGASPAWRELDGADRGWTLRCRRGATLGGTLGAC